MITITENATNEINNCLAESNEPYLRISVQGGGCSGFNYVFDFEKNKGEDDLEIGKVLVDSMSMMYLTGATVDYVEDLMGSSFNIDNPNASTTCGCGSSFSV
jgi:iron-sulfur cluster assembly accessory protein